MIQIMLSVQKKIFSHLEQLFLKHELFLIFIIPCKSILFRSNKKVTMSSVQQNENLNLLYFFHKVL